MRILKPAQASTNVGRIAEPDLVSAKIFLLTGDNARYEERLRHALVRPFRNRTRLVGASYSVVLLKSRRADVPKPFGPANRCNPANRRERSSSSS